MTNKIKSINDSKLINSADFFATVVERMHKEGNGLLSATLVTPDDATKMLLLHMFGVAPSSAPIYFMECDKFLKSLAEGPPMCSADGCSNPLHKHVDVGAIVIVHGMCDEPVTTIVSGICAKCWTERFKEDRDQALNGYLDYLRQLLPGMKTHETTDFMTGNAPSSTSVN